MMLDIYVLLKTPLKAFNKNEKYVDTPEPAETDKIEATEEIVKDTAEEIKSECVVNDTEKLKMTNTDNVEKSKGAGMTSQSESSAPPKEEKEGKTDE